MKEPVSICSALFVAVTVVLALSCRPGKSPGDERGLDDQAGDTVQYRFNPIDLPEDRQVVPSRYPVTGDITGRTPVSVEAELAIDTPAVPVRDLPEVSDTASSQVFRVQLFTSKVFGEARQAKIVADEIFDRPVDLDYEVPYFKVRVGKFEDRHAAEDYLQRVRAAGYLDAWVVVSAVSVKRAPPLYLDQPVLWWQDTAAADSMTGDTVNSHSQEDAPSDED